MIDIMTLPHNDDDFRFLKHVNENPDVLLRLNKLANDARKAGVKKIGIDLLYARLRWDMMVETRTDDFKLNNDFRPYYSRVLMALDSRLNGMFDIRGDEGNIEFLRRGVYKIFESKNLLTVKKKAA